MQGATLQSPADVTRITGDSKQTDRQLDKKWKYRYIHWQTEEAENGGAGY